MVISESWHSSGNGSLSTVKSRMMRNFIVILPFFVFVLTIPASAQKSAKLREIHEDADYFFEREDYKEAITQYMLLLDNGYESANIRFKIGVCYLNIPGEEIRSIPYLEEASKHISVKDNPKGVEQLRAPLHVLFYLGNAYRINNELSKALAAYDKFTSHPGFFGNYNLDMVDAEIKACERAKFIQDHPVEVEWKNLGDSVNTSTAETCPVVSGNDSVLVYLSAQKLYNAIFFSKKDASGNWRHPVNINPQVISDGDFYPTGLSYDGTELYLVRKEKANSDIYVSYYRDGKWTKVQKLNGNVNTTFLENYASISPDGNMLLFTR
jgi:tetratricopeptide (TPR) repeat protein